MEFLFTFLFQEVKQFVVFEVTAEIKLTYLHASVCMFVQFCVFSAGVLSLCVTCVCSSEVRRCPEATT